MLRSLFITKPIAAAGHVDAGEPVEGSLEGEITLKRTLTAKQLFLLGVGAIIGAGIFVMTGTAAANYAGPAVILSFVIAGTACAFAGLCYAEFAAMLPVSGSAYSYAYTTLGEFVAWFIGWTLVLEYLLAASTVAVGWSGYMNSFLGTLGMAIPDVLSSAPLDMVQGSIHMTGALINLPAVLIVAAITGLVYVGISQSAWVNAIIVTIKVVVILLFLAFGLKYVNPENWVPFIPDRVIDADGTSHYGIQGVIRASAVVFFAYIGFDAVSTAAGEAKNPQRDMPIGILGSLVFCTILYIAMSAALTGMMPYGELGTAKPVATALQNYPDLLWLKTVVELGAIAGLSSVILVMLMGQPRIFYSMAKDGLMPGIFGKVHPKHRTPYIGTVIVGVVAASMAGLFPISFLGDLVSMGTLLAFATVCVGVLILRRTRPDIRRAFRVPAASIVCPLGAAACLYLFWQPFTEHWHLMLGWTAIGMSIYALYGYRHSRLRQRS